MGKLLSAAVIAGALLFGASATAHAAEQTRSADAASLAAQSSPANQTAPWSLSAPRQRLQWDSNGKWGLRLDMNQPAVRDPDWKDMQASAFFRITPSLRVGGTVQFGDRLAQPRQVTPSDAAAPRVHLETAFRF